MNPSHWSYIWLSYAIAGVLVMFDVVFTRIRMKKLQREIRAASQRQKQAKIV
jgi:heme exporter protein CcmD